MAHLVLGGSVGSGGKNSSDDVKKVVDRFVELGFTWVSGCTKGSDNKLIKTIKLFQSICKGSGKVEGDGRIDKGGTTNKWLAAENAPGWVRIFGVKGIGISGTTDLAYGESNGGFGTTWLLDRLKWAGIVYSAKAMISVSNAPPLWIRDCSPMTGGNAAGHKSHETGIDVDIRLPLLPPHTNEHFQLRGHDYSKYFHFDAAWAQAEAIRAVMDPKYVFFNDPRFIKAKLTTHEANHSEHFHVRIKPPARIEGVVI